MYLLICRDWNRIKKYTLREPVIVRLTVPDIIYHLENPEGGNLNLYYQNKRNLLFFFRFSTALDRVFYETYPIPVDNIPFVDNIIFKFSITF